MGEVIMTVLGNGVGLIVLAFGAGCVIVALVVVYFFGYAGLVTGLAKLAKSEGVLGPPSRWLISQFYHYHLQKKKPFSKYSFAS